MYAFMAGLPGLTTNAIAGETFCVVCHRDTEDGSAELFLRILGETIRSSSFVTEIE